MRTTHYAQWALRFLNILALAGAVAVAAGWVPFPTMWVLPLAAVFLLSVSSWVTAVGSRRTESGRELCLRADGFHEMLVSEPQDAPQGVTAARNLYAAYLPFAVAAGSAELWAHKYQTIAGLSAPHPPWFHPSGVWYGSGGGSGGSGSSGVESFNSFDSALSSSIGAYSASVGGGYGGGGWRRRWRWRWRRRRLVVTFLLIVALLIVVAVLVGLWSATTRIARPAPGFLCRSAGTPPTQTYSRGPVPPPTTHR